jgi:hypothetical protein
MIHTDTETGSQPRPTAMVRASRRFRSTVPTRSFTSTMSVLSSMTRSARVPGEDVDHAAFAVDRERDLRFDRPRRQVATEHPGDLLVQSGVPGIEEPVEIARAPPRDQVDPDVEGGRDSSHNLEGEGVDVPSLDARDRRRGDAGRLSEVGLPATAAYSNGPHGGA